MFNIADTTIYNQRPGRSCKHGTPTYLTVTLICTISRTTYMKPENMEWKDTV